MRLYNVAVCLMVVSVAAARRPFRSMVPDEYPRMWQNGVDPGEPLFLTPLIDQGKFDEAMALSKVPPLDGSENFSYSGFITVNKTLNSNLFFWFFPARIPQLAADDAPVLLWLQGGPGASSLIGLFLENGPYTVTEDFKIVTKPFTWNNRYSMLYIDNPVGTGFSFTDRDTGYATNEEDVARDLYSCLIQFFQVFRSYQKNDFYVTGESYAGKYVPAISYKIHMENPSAQLKINLVGMAIGDGFSDPETMIPNYADFLYSIGMFDEKQRGIFQGYADQCVAAIRNQDFIKAFQIFDMLLNGDEFPDKTFFYNATLSNNYLNFMMTELPESLNYYGHLLADPVMRKNIHVGNLTYNDGSVTEKHMLHDFMDTVKPWVAVLMNNYKVMIYTGQLDIIVAVPLAEAFLMSVPWSGQADYAKADRLVWKVDPEDQEVAGYVRQVGKFLQVIVRGAGHFLPMDQPERGFDMISRFIENRSFTSVPRH